MPHREYDVPLVPLEAADQMLAYVLGENGDGPKTPRPDIKTSTIQVQASNKGEAAKIAQTLYPGYLAVRKAIKEHKNA